MKIMQNSEQKSNSEKERLDFGISGIPLLAILLMCFFFFRFPEFESGFIRDSQLFGFGICRILPGLGALYLSSLFVYCLFSLWNDCFGKAGRDAGIFFFYLGKYDVHCGARGGYLVLLSL